MEIIIKEDGQKITLSNEDFQVDNFVNLLIEDKEKDSYKVLGDMDVPIDELYSAVKAFYDHRIRERKANGLLKE